MCVESARNVSQPGDERRIRSFFLELIRPATEDHDPGQDHPEDS